MDCNKNVPFHSRCCCNVAKALLLQSCLLLAMHHASILRCHNGVKIRLLRSVVGKVCHSEGHHVLSTMSLSQFLKGVGSICEGNHHVPCSGTVRTMELGGWIFLGKKSQTSKKEVVKEFFKHSRILFDHITYLSYFSKVLLKSISQPGLNWNMGEREGRGSGYSNGFL